MATIKEAIEYSKVNPDSAFATELRRRIESGQMNNELKAAGLTQFLAPEEPTLVNKLEERGKTLVGEVTGKPTSDILAGADTSSVTGILGAGTQALARTAQAPIRALGAVGGAIGDVVGAGLEASGVTKPLGQALQPVVQSEPIQKAMEVYKSLPQDTQEVLASILNTANIPATGLVGSIAKTGVESAVKGVAKGITPVGTGVKKAGELVYKSAYTPSVAEAERVLAYEASQPSFFSSLYGAGAIKGNPSFKPITTSETALRAGIAGTEKQVGVQAKQVADTLWNNEIAPAVKGIKGVISKEELFTPLQQRVSGITDPTMQKAYQNALDSLIEDYASRKSFTYPEAQALKSELAQFTPAKVFRGQDVANETRMLQADMANVIRQKTYEKLKDINVKQKYIDYGNLQELQKVGIKAITEGGKKGGFGTFWSSLYDTAMTPVKTIGGKTIYRIGDKLEVTAPSGFENKPLSDYLKAVGYLTPTTISTSVKSEQ